MRNLETCTTPVMALNGQYFSSVFPEHTFGQHLKIGEGPFLSSHFKSTKYNNPIVSFYAIEGMQLIESLNNLQTKFNTECSVTPQNDN